MMTWMFTSAMAGGKLRCTFRTGDRCVVFSISPGDKWLAMATVITECKDDFSLPHSIH